MRLNFSFVCLRSAKNLLLLGFVAWCGFCRCVWLLFFEVTLEIDTMLLQVILPGNLRGILGGTF